MDRRRDDSPLGRRTPPGSSTTPPPSVHEASYLRLDASPAPTPTSTGTPHLRLDTALDWLVQWYRAWQSGADMHTFTLAQIAAYESLL
jgi:CDP-glucose 4,6-dehydratase